MFRSKNKTCVHLIGIGGIGMSAIAEVLVNLGYKVKGSDASENANVAKLKTMGVEVTKGHAANNIGEASVVVYSTAITMDNPEVVEAKEKNLPLIRRAEMLTELMRLKYGIAIAGTHGKTTTTGMLATIFQECDVDATHIIGGVVHNLGGHAKVGKSEFLLTEADESDGTFLLLSPVFSVITNIDNDHMDYYQTEEKLNEAFVEFANRVPFYGCVALNYHDERIQENKELIKRPKVFFGIEVDDPDVEYVAKDICSRPGNSEYKLFFRNELVGTVSLKVNGQHNVLNSLGAIAIAHQMEIPFDQIINGIASFEGVSRRLQLLHEGDGFRVFDDYGHHPTEINATISALKELSDNKLVVFFEPHRYSRTKICWKSFFHCFNKADKVYMSPIYGHSEPVIEGITSKRLAEDINKIHPGLVEHIDSLDEMGKIINQNLSKKPVTFLSLGAGTIGTKIRQCVDQLK